MQLYPEVIDDSTLGARFSPTQFLAVGVEGWAATTGADATVGQVYTISNASEAEQRFGNEAAPTLTPLIKFLLQQGANPVYAVASVKHDTIAPIQAERESAWESLDQHEVVRLRLTDDETNAIHQVLATHMGYADQMQNKQVAFVGEASATSKATLLSSASAIDDNRVCLVGPGVYKDGTLYSGMYAAAAVAAEVAKNSDIADDLDLLPIPNLGGIELDATGFPLFKKTNPTGTVINDHEDLLQGGVCSLETYNSGTRITHLTTTYQTDGSYDSLMTRLIVDQVFVDIRDYLNGSLYLRRQNSSNTRNILEGAIKGLLEERQEWIAAVPQPDGTLGYNVGVTASADGRQLIISYEGEVVRGISTIKVNANLTIAT